MGHQNLDVSLPEDFQGKVRLFPLPNLVLFPCVIQALHIFEPRYCDMLAEALASDQLIAMALLKPGWEAQYGGKPPIADVVCIGKIMSHSPTEDQRHNILLAGVKRARIISEIPSSDAFRSAHVEILEDVYSSSAHEERSKLRSELADLLRFAIPDSHAAENVAQLFANQIPLGIMADLLGYGARLPLSAKQQLLETIDVDQRCRILIRHLRSLKGETPNPFEEPGKPATPTSTFPPPFSDN